MSPWQPVVDMYRNSAPVRGMLQNQPLLKRVPTRRSNGCVAINESGGSGGLLAPGGDDCFFVNYIYGYGASGKL